MNTICVTDVDVDSLFPVITMKYGAASRINLNGAMLWTLT